MIFTILFFTYFWISVALTSPICLVLFLFKIVGLGKFIKKPLQLVISLWAKTIIWASGSKVSVKGLENIPKTGNLCFIPNHQGNFDVILLLAYVPRQIGFIAKSEALYFPFVNLWVYTIGSLFITRKSLKQSHETIEKGIQKMKKGQDMVIFPEGTRSRSEKILPFKAGSFKLATRSESILIPVTINKTYKIWEETKNIKSARMSLEFHAPIDTRSLSLEERKLLSEKVQSIIQQGLVNELT